MRAAGVGGVEAEGFIFPDDLLHFPVDDGVASCVAELAEAGKDGAGERGAVAQHEADDRLVLVQDGVVWAVFELGEGQVLLGVALCGSLVDAVFCGDGFVGHAAEAVEADGVDRFGHGRHLRVVGCYRYDYSGVRGL